MDNLTLIVTISAAIFSLVAGKAILSSRSSQASESSEIKGRARKVNESLYELHKPSGPPSIQIVLFHGLQPGGYLDAHLRTWQCEDASCIWPQTWLVDTVPGAHVLSISYNQGLESTSHGESDMYIITENILSDLLQENIGQEAYCPVILVGHSIGGLVIKHLCNRAHGRLQNKSSSETVKLEKFLNNIEAIFYYATPHHGTSIPKKWEKDVPAALLTYFKALSKDTQRLNHEFDNLDRVRNWSFFSVGEDHATNLGSSNDRCLLVPEASARVGDFNIVNGADHFSICQPRDRSSRSFYKLQELVHRIASEAQDAKNREVMRLQEEARALEKRRPDNFQHVPSCVTGLDSKVQAIKNNLDNVRTLGLVGMGGLGKSTLAKEVFNRLGPSFDYTCFIANVKLIDGDEVKLIDKIKEHMHFHGKKVKNDQGWRTKPLLLVLDDTDRERDEKVLSEMDETMASEARIIFTTRNQCPKLGFGDVYKVDFLEEESAKQLFLRYAFRDCQASATQFERLTNAIIMKCDRLPLALEVLGKFLGTTKDYRVWEQTLRAMDRAEDHPEVNESYATNATAVLELLPPPPASALDFLRLLFDNKSADGILKGDAIIVVEGKIDGPLYVQKFILSNKSPVFFKMFDKKMLEEKTGMVHIDDATLPVIRSLIKFCYDAEIKFTEEVTGEEVLAVAHKYDIALLRTTCEEYLIATINNSNLSKRLKLAKRFEVTCLERAATTYLQKNFNNVISDVLVELC